MAKLTKAQVNEIKSAISSLGAAIADIENERTILAQESLVPVSAYHNKFSYRKKDPVMVEKGDGTMQEEIMELHVMSKIGRNFVQAYTAMDTLQDFLKTHTTKHNYLDQAFNNPLDQIDNLMEPRK